MVEKEKAELVTILGHTAAGKTRLAACLARRLGGEIISADSRQVYRGMDLGTGKDYDDYLVEGERIPVHLVDIAEAGEEYNVFRFSKDFAEAFRNIRKKGKVPLMCGGTGLYLESVLRNYHLIRVPVNRELRGRLDKLGMNALIGILEKYGPLHNITDTVNRKRLIRAIEIAAYHHERKGQADVQLLSVPEKSLILGIRYDREIRRERITRRLKERLSGGLVGEVAGLLERGVPPEKLDYYGLEYRFVTRYILKEITYEEMFSGLNTAIHRFAKRQMTYFRGMERRGVRIHWLEGEMPLEKKIEMALELYETVT